MKKIGKNISFSCQIVDSQPIVHCFVIYSLIPLVFFFFRYHLAGTLHLYKHVIFNRTNVWLISWVFYSSASMTISANTARACQFIPFSQCFASVAAVDKKREEIDFSSDAWYHLLTVQFVQFVAQLVIRSSQMLLVLF